MEGFSALRTLVPIISGFSLWLFHNFFFMKLLVAPLFRFLIAPLFGQHRLQHMGNGRRAGRTGAEFFTGTQSVLPTGAALCLFELLDDVLNGRAASDGRGDHTTDRFGIAAAAAIANGSIAVGDVSVFVVADCDVQRAAGCFDFELFALLPLGNLHDDTSGDVRRNRFAVAGGQDGSTLAAVTEHRDALAAVSPRL